MKTWELTLIFVRQVARIFVFMLWPRLLLGKASLHFSGVVRFLINVLNLAPKVAAPALNYLYKQSSAIIHYWKKHHILHHGFRLTLLYVGYFVSVQPQLSCSIFRYWKGTVRSPWSFLFYRLNTRLPHRKFVEGNNSAYIFRRRAPWQISPKWLIASGRGLWDIGTTGFWNCWNLVLTVNEWGRCWTGMYTWKVTLDHGLNWERKQSSASEM